VGTTSETTDVAGNAPMMIGEWVCPVNGEPYGIARSSDSAWARRNPHDTVVRRIVPMFAASEETRNLRDAFEKHIRPGTLQLIP
jgi:hypothetical protein